MFNNRDTRRTCPRKKAVPGIASKPGKCGCMAVIGIVSTSVVGMAKCFSVKRIAIAAVLCRNVHHIRRQSGAKYKEYSAPTLFYEMLEHKL